MRTITTIIFCVFVACISLFFGSVEAQAPAPIQKFTQLLPFRFVNPGQHVYVKVGTIGTEELSPCVAAVKVWNPQNFQLKIYVDCRIQSDGYAAVVVKNEGAEAVAIYDKITVAVIR